MNMVGILRNVHTLSRLRIFLRNNLLDRRIKRWNFIYNHILYDIIIDAKIAMNKSITHSGNHAPLNDWIFLPDRLRHIFYCLANNLNTPHIRTLQGLIL